MTWKLYQGDCLEVIRTISNESIDLILTSPPYNLGNFKKGSFYDGKGKGEHLKYDTHNDRMDEEDYKNWQRNVLIECYRTLKPTGAIFYNHKPRIINGLVDDRKNLIPLGIRQEIIWDRCCMVNFSGSFYAPNTERIFIIAKPEWRPRKEYVRYGEVWRIPPETNNPHPAPFPKLLAKRVILSASKENDLILDPFAGSGTTLLVAEECKRNSIGIEISEAYCKIIRERLSELQPCLF